MLRTWSPAFPLSRHPYHRSLPTTLFPMNLRLITSLLLANFVSALVLPNLNDVNVQNLFALSEASGNHPESGIRPESGIHTESGIKETLAPIINAINNAIPNKYIVVLKEGFSESEIAAHNDWIGSLTATMMKRHGCHDDMLPEFFGLPTLNGYMGKFNKAVVEEIRKSPMVAYVEQDKTVRTYGTATQTGAPWGIARVSHRDLSSSFDYVYNTQGGEGVTAYVIDTGIKTDHPDFEGRAVWGKSLAFPPIELDLHGHGTHVAGTIGSKTYGVAKNVNLSAVRVMNPLGSGTISDIIKGLEFAVKDHNEKVASKTKGFKGSTVNMSIGGGVSEALDQVANAAVKAGLHLAIAAGNDNEDACNYSPARASGPITVGSTDKEDAKSDFSNHGKCVDVNAPGSDIESLGILSETMIMSGTSMATPHVTGVLSYLLSLHPGYGSEFSAEDLVTPEELKKRFLKFATKDVLSGLTSETPNLLAYTGGAKGADFWA